MDEPPPEYDNPMTPALDNAENYGGYVQSNIYQESYEQAGTSSSDGMFESPPTPGMRRVTRSKARGATAPAPNLTMVKYCFRSMYDMLFMCFVAKLFSDEYHREG